MCFFSWCKPKSASMESCDNLEMIIENLSLLHEYDKHVTSQHFKQTLESVLGEHLESDFRLFELIRISNAISSFLLLKRISMLKKHTRVDFDVLLDCLSHYKLKVYRYGKHCDFSMVKTRDSNDMDPLSAPSL